MFATGLVTETKGETPKETYLCCTENPQQPLDREHTGNSTELSVTKPTRPMSVLETSYKPALSLTTKIARAKPLSVLFAA